MSEKSCGNYKSLANFRHFYFIFRALMPLDMWLYEYALNIFNARLHYLSTGENITPAMPPSPHVFCKSTRYILACSDGPLGAFVYRWPRLDNIEDEDERNKQEGYYQAWMDEQNGEF